MCRSSAIFDVANNQIQNSTHLVPGQVRVTQAEYEAINLAQLEELWSRLVCVAVATICYVVPMACVATVCVAPVAPCVFTSASETSVTIQHPIFFPPSNWLYSLCL